MTDIKVTQAAVRKLAETLAKTNTTHLRHTERLALIAEAFGWKADAFMHALKNSGMAKIKPTRQSQPSCDWSVLLGVTESAAEKISLILKQTVMKPGIIIVSGHTGSGKSTTASAFAKYAEDAGFLMSDRLPPAWEGGNFLEWKSRVLNRPRINETFLIEEMRTQDVAEFAVQLAEMKNIVVVGMIASTAIDALVRFSELVGREAVVENVRGAISQYLMRRRCNCNSEICIMQPCSGYKGRFPLVDVVKDIDLLKYRTRNEPFMDCYKHDVLEAFASDMLDRDTLINHFGEDILKEICRL